MLKCLTALYHWLEKHTFFFKVSKTEVDRIVSKWELNTLIQLSLLCTQKHHEGNSILQLWPDLRKPNIIVQYRFFSIKHWNTLGKLLRILKKIRSLLYPPCSWWRKRPTVKNWVSSYLPKQEKLENLCLVAVHPRNCKLWPFVHVTLKRPFAIDVSSWILTLWWCRTVEGITYPVIYSLVHGEHGGAKF